MFRWSRYFFKMFILSIIFLCNILQILSQQLPYSCESKIYCHGRLLETIQTAGLFNDSKTFVDMPMRYDEAKTLSAFDELMNSTNNEPSNEDLRGFVGSFFEDSEELEAWTPPDWKANPKILDQIADPEYRRMMSKLVHVWLDLARKVGSNAKEHPEKTSLIPLEHGFIIPGGRFKEIYYWDSYWIVQGLLLSEMNDTARGVIENLLDLVKRYGFVPNGSRVYYTKRSQPPLLTAMVWNYWNRTGDKRFLFKVIGILESEIKFWLRNRTVRIRSRQKKYRILARYNAPSEGPRPESYAQDVETARNATDKEQVYVDIKSTAESGWDFSTRWLSSETRHRATKDSSEEFIATTSIIPVDLNAILCGACRYLAYFNHILGNTEDVIYWNTFYKKIRDSIEDILWDENAGSWFDFDLETGQRRKQFFASNIVPLWTGCVDRNFINEKAVRIYRSFKKSGALDLPGGVPCSINNSGQQWDYPNAWAPLQSMIIQAFSKWGDESTENAALELASRWAKSNYKGWKSKGTMFEKYDAEHPGESGNGGEYLVQAGFGWTNGVMFEIMSQYGLTLSTEDKLKQLSDHKIYKKVPISYSAYNYKIYFNRH